MIVITGGGIIQIACLVERYQIFIILLLIHALPLVKIISPSRLHSQINLIACLESSLNKGIFRALKHRETPP